MITFDFETRQFTSVVSEDQKEYAMNPLKTALYKVGGKAINDTYNHLSGRDKKRTLWGRISGKNKALDKEDERKHELALARINAGVDNRSLLKNRLEAHDAKVQRRDPFKQSMQSKKLDYKHQEKMKKLDSKL